MANHLQQHQRRSPEICTVFAAIATPAMIDRP
jgi:hypothetical protein